MTRAVTPASDQQPIPVILGPTASGKSAAAMSIAQHLPIEIISVDSAQIYTGMDIGTAKPSLSEREQVPHHLIDVIDPADSYSAGRFCRDTAELIVQIQQRGRIPVLVGGTMLYIKALSEGLNTLPGADQAIRTRIEKRAEQLGWPALHTELAQVDPASAARLQPGDAQRIQRALEIYQSTGQTMTELLAHKSKPLIDPDRLIRVALEPSDRSVLHDRIAHRFHDMIAAGFIDEVQSLRNRADLHASLPSIRSVGYRQLWHWLDGESDSSDDNGGGNNKNLNNAIDAGIAATRQLAKRQLTWLRAMPKKITIDCLATNASDQTMSAFMQAAPSLAKHA